MARVVDEIRKILMVVSIFYDIMIFKEKIVIEDDKLK